MHLRPPFVHAALLVLWALLLDPGASPAQTADVPPQGTATALPAAPPAPAGELDAFMAKVLARRDVNRALLEQYVLDEVESFELVGPGRAPLHRRERDYTWYVRDGMHVRSPVRANGVPVGREAREQYEAGWIRRERARQERKARKDAGAEAEGAGATVDAPGGALARTEPRFVSEAYFMDFKFEPGNYYLVGRETLEGQEVLRIEYYPTRMFDGSDDPKDTSSEKTPPGTPADADDRRDRKGTHVEREIQRRMNKTSLITLWIDPAEHQIVKYTFENVWLDFLPGAWLVRVDDIRASMVMGQPFPGVWLPRSIAAHAAVSLAAGAFEANYARTFKEYRLAEVKTRIGIPKRGGDGAWAPLRPGGHGSPSAVAPIRSAPMTLIRAPSRPGRAAEPHVVTASARLRPGRAAFASGRSGAMREEIVAEVRVHGNAFLTDGEVIALAGMAVGQALPPDGTAGIVKRLEDSGRFDTVDVRKRYRSLDAAGDIAIILVVHEKPGVGPATEGVDGHGVPGSVSRRAGRLRSALMFLPIVSFADGYGFTYGGRLSTIDLLGLDERLSVPLTWGGTRRAALEFERPFKTGPLTRIQSSVAIWNRENPRFGIRDERVEIAGRAERVFADLVRTGVEASRSTISFGSIRDRLWTFGTSVAFDTRLDPAFPANAVLLEAGWTALHFRTRAERVHRYTTDARGYLRLYRQVVLAGRARYTTADAPLPPYERALLGGSSSLRGFRTGTFDGDRVVAASAEVRVPITSVLSGARFGVTAFIDAGTAWDVGGALDAAAWKRGAGGGIFLIASLVRINVDVARPARTGGTRVHLSSGFSF